MRKDSGFSLIELIVTMAILGILAGIAIPNFIQWIPKYRVKDAAQDLYSNVQMAKMEAIKRNADCTITFSKAPDQYQISLINKTVQLGDYGSEVQYAAGFVPAVVTFNSRGFVDNGISVDLTNGAKSASYQISILTSGVVSIN